MKLNFLEIKNNSIFISWNEENDELWEFIFSLNQNTNIKQNLIEKNFEIGLNDVDVLIDELTSIRYDDEALITNLKSLNENSVNLVKVIEETKTKKYEDLIVDDSNFQSYVSSIVDNLNVSTDGEYSVVTRKQLVKTYAMSKLGSYMNFSEPGAGKTLMTLMSLVNNVKDNEVVIIVSPINSMNVWNDEIKKFLKWENKAVHFYNSDMHSKFSDENDVDITDFDYAKFILINYESASKLANHRTSMRVISELKGGYHLVFDEAHRVKNGKSVRNEISKKLSGKAKSIITLTGTPFSKEISEVVEMMNLTWPSNIPFVSKNKLDEYAYEINLSQMGEVKSLKDIDPYTRQVLSELSKSISPLYFALKKKIDFGIPDAIDKYDDPLMVDYLPVQKELDTFIFEKTSKLKQQIFSEKTMKKKKELIEILGYYYTAAQQNSINPNLVYSLENIDFDNILNKYEKIPFEDLPKIKESLNFVKSKVDNGEKVIVWFNFVKNIKEFRRLLELNGINAKEIYGHTEKDERKEIIDSFAMPGSAIDVLVSNPATLAESISLHKSVHTSLFVERTFSYFRWAQAKDRIHRVGSPPNVEHNYIKTKGLKMEETLFSNLNRKKIVAEEILRHPNDFEGFISQGRLIEMEENDGLIDPEYLE